LSGTSPESPNPGFSRPLLADRGIEKSVRLLMDRHAPAYVVVNATHDILRFSGATERYLAPSPGAASLNLFSLIRRALRPAARAALAKAIATGKSVRHDALAIEVNGERQLVDLAVEPVPDGEAGLCVVAFIDREAGVPGKRPAGKKPALPVAALEKELRVTRERLEVTIDQLETSNEEMKSANEEFQSVNEELQSTNEELETSKEELQSINEELQTVNAELNGKNATLLQVNSDIKNLLDSTQIATLFLDPEGRIRGFTPPMTDILHLRDGDIGRPVTDIASRLSYDELIEDARTVMRDLSIVEREVVIKDDTSFLMRLRPYRTIGNVVNGVVITFVDITDRKRSDDVRLHMIDELNHRVKNTLTIVQALADRSFKGSVDVDKLRVFEGRLVSLSKTHSLLSRQSWQSVPLRDLADQELKPYRRDDSANVLIEGPELHLKSNATLALGLALHELVTNAVKYGALANESGKLRLAWDVVRAPGAASLRLTWSESGGPPVVEPKRRGFGSTVIERGLTRELGGEVKIDWRGSGMLYTIVLPLASIEAPGTETLHDD
jgi:two-component system, chemotaxis family, CheB/CheR fusion protein